MTTVDEIFFWTGLGLIVLGCWFIVAEKAYAFGNSLINLCLTLWLIQYLIDVYVSEGAKG